MGFTFGFVCVCTYMCVYVYVREYGVCVYSAGHCKVLIIIIIIYGIHQTLPSPSSNPNAMNMKKVADLFGEVIGVLSLAR